MAIFRDGLRQDLLDPDFREYFEELRPAHDITLAMVDARHELNLTQKELSERTGIAQAEISKLEQGESNPTIRTLQRLAKGMGKRLQISFEDLEQTPEEQIARLMNEPVEVTKKELAKLKRNKGKNAAIA